jgi:hypothetical protein
MVRGCLPSGKGGKVLIAESGGMPYIGCDSAAPSGLRCGSFGIFRPGDIPSNN